jgi:hypothetical protein
MEREARAHSKTAGSRISFSADAFESLASFVIFVRTPGPTAQPLSLRILRTLLPLLAPWQAAAPSSGCKLKRHFQIGMPSPGRPSLAHFSVTVRITSSDMRIGTPHSRSVSPAHLSVASRPILEPRPETGEAKSR